MAEALHQIESNSIYERDPRSLDALRTSLRNLQKYGITYAQIAEATGVNRATISQFVNKNEATTYANIDRMLQYVAQREAEIIPLVAETPQQQGMQNIGLWQTEEFQAAMGWMHYVWGHRKMGVLVGAPGTGKTTILKQFKQTFVDDIKASRSDGKLTKDEIAKLRSDLFEKAKDKMSQPAYDILLAAGVDVNALILGAGDAFIEEIKRGTFPEGALLQGVVVDD